MNRNTYLPTTLPKANIRGEYKTVGQLPPRQIPQGVWNGNPATPRVVQKTKVFIDPHKAPTLYFGGDPDS